MRKRGLRCRPCLSVPPSIRHVGVLYCIQTAEDMVKLFSRPGSTMILVFWTPNADTQFPGGTPSAGTQNTREWENFAIFD